MDNIKQGLMFAVGLIITIAIIALSLRFFTKSNDIAKNAEGDLSNISSSVNQAKYQMYDGAIVSGSDVVNAVKTMASSSFIIYVGTGATAYTTAPTGTNTPVTGNVGLTFDSASDTIEANPTQPAFIDPVGRFKGMLCLNANKTVVGIAFTQQ